MKNINIGKYKIIYKYDCFIEKPTLCTFKVYDFFDFAVKTNDEPMGSEFFVYEL